LPARRGQVGPGQGRCGLAGAGPGATEARPCEHGHGHGHAVQFQLFGWARLVGGGRLDPIFSACFVQRRRGREEAPFKTLALYAPSDAFITTRSSRWCRSSARHGRATCTAQWAPIHAFEAESKALIDPRPAGASSAAPCTLSRWALGAAARFACLSDHSAFGRGGSVSCFNHTGAGDHRGVQVLQGPDHLGAI
jgi:hypothetical protein